MNYTAYLNDKGYAITTITAKKYALAHFKDWCTTNHYQADRLDYKTALGYIKHLKGKDNSKRTINTTLGHIKTYYEYLIVVGERIDNPLAETTLKNVTRGVHHQLLQSEELEDLYYSYETENIKDGYRKAVAKRNKVITGLIVYQGLGTSTLSQLKTEHLQLHKGKIYIPSTRKSNSRELELKSWQILELMEYTTTTRNVFIQKFKTENKALFPINTRFTVITSQLVKKLKRYNAKVKDIKQLRASVITNWLKLYNLRQVQYMAGHRYISSTETYLQDDLENLHDMVDSLHPIS